jgi:hypothetical protein
MIIQNGNITCFNCSFLTQNKNPLRKGLRFWLPELFSVCNFIVFRSKTALLTKFSQFVWQSEQTQNGSLHIFN